MLSLHVPVWERGLSLSTQHALIAEFGRQHTKRRGEPRAVFFGLDHRRNDALYRFQMHTIGEILERLAPLGQEAGLDRRQREFLAQLGIGAAQFLRQDRKSTRLNSSH